MKRLVKADFLFPNSDYITGAASAFNLAGNFYEYNVSESGQEADVKAIASDWNIIAEDLKNAMTKMDATLNNR